MKLIIQPAWNRAGYNLWVLQEDGSKYRVAKPSCLEFGDTKEDDSFQLPEPTIFIRHREWQELQASFKSEAIANGLYKDPIRLQGELEATKRHLEDLQKLVFTLHGWKKE